MPELNLGALTTSVQNGSDNAKINNDMELIHTSPTDSSSSLLSELTDEHKVDVVKAEEVTVIRDIDEEDSSSDPDLRNTRIYLTNDNTRRLDVLRFSQSEIGLSRTQLANDIIAKYFSKHAEELASNVKELLEKLKE